MVTSKEVKWVMVSALFSVGLAGRTMLGRRPTWDSAVNRRQYGEYDGTDNYDGGHYEEDTPSNKQNYFHYHHRPEEDRYEFGYRRGNNLHTRERYEKAGPFDGHFKTKVRWADRKGGHGEHYWDYNHAGHVGRDEEDGYVEETRPEPPKQQYKRQTTYEDDSDDAEEFLRSFRENVGGAFGLAELTDKELGPGTYEEHDSY